MRPMIPAFIAAVVLAVAPAAMAAPTCQSEGGDTARCGTPGAMPVGWAPSAEQLADRRMAQTDGPSPETLLSLACVLAGIFGLIGMMPEFDGSRGSDWGEQEGDDER